MSLVDASVIVRHRILILGAALGLTA